jgi:hypothetical protein
MKNPCVIFRVTAVALLSAYVSPGQMTSSGRTHAQSQTSNSRGDLDAIRSSLADTKANLDQMHREIKAMGEKVEEVRFQLDRQIGRTTKEGDQRIKDLEAKVGKVGEDLKAQAGLLKAREDEIRALREAMQVKAAEPAGAGSRARKWPASRGAKGLRRCVAATERKTTAPRFRSGPSQVSQQRFCGQRAVLARRVLLRFEGIRSSDPGVRRSAAEISQGRQAAALLKQGLFPLGDKVDARLILQELVDRDPQPKRRESAMKLKLWALTCHLLTRIYVFISSPGRRSPGA